MGSASPRPRRSFGALVALCLLATPVAQDDRPPYPNGVWGESCIVTAVADGTRARQLPTLR